jgi:hypothetical protein
MRGAPQKGLAAAIFLIKARTSGLVSGRPLRFRLETQVQKSRKPLRCQDTTVPGLTMIKAWRQFFQVLERHSQNNRSAFRSRGRGQRRLSTVSCWRRAKFSRAISRTLPGRTRRRISEPNSATMGFSVRARGEQSQLFPVERSFGEAHRTTPSGSLKLPDPRGNLFPLELS